MNEFTQKQEDVIRELARNYHKELNKDWTDDFIPAVVRHQLEDQYVDAILSGLKDPYYWGLDKPVFYPVD